MADENRPRLGRGLAALLGETKDVQKADRAARGVQKAPIDLVRPNPRNPRKTFEESELESLADSVREKGVIQPLLVRRGADEGFEIIAGERRWRAAQRAGLHEIPVVLVEATDQESLELAIIENVQRSDLNPIDEAQGYARLQSEFAYTQADVAKVVGKSRSHVANTLRLLTLPEATRNLMVSGALSAGHARALVGADDADALARRAVERGLTVRDLEALIQGRGRKAGAGGGGAGRGGAERDPNTAAIEKELSDSLGVSVALDDQGGRGALTIRYSSLDQLDLILARLRS